MISKLALAAVVTAYVGYILFEMIIPSLTHKTMLRWRIVRLGEGTAKGMYQVQYKHWPWSPWWSDMAALEGYAHYSLTVFPTFKEALEEIRQTHTEIFRERAKDKVFRLTCIWEDKHG